MKNDINGNEKVIAIISNTLSIPGYGTIQKGRTFPVFAMNKRFVYCEVDGRRVTLKLTHKDCDIRKERR